MYLRGPQKESKTLLRCPNLDATCARLLYVYISRERERADDEIKERKNKHVFVLFSNGCHNSTHSNAVNWL